MTLKFSFLAIMAILCSNLWSQNKRHNNVNSSSPNAELPEFGKPRIKNGFLKMMVGYTYKVPHEKFLWVYKNYRNPKCSIDFGDTVTIKEYDPEREVFIAKVNRGPSPDSTCDEGTELYIHPNYFLKWPRENEKADKLTAKLSEESRIAEEEYEKFRYKFQRSDNNTYDLTNGWLEGSITHQITLLGELFSTWRGSGAPRGPDSFNRGKVNKLAVRGKRTLIKLSGSRGTFLMWVDTKELEKKTTLRK